MNRKQLVAIAIAIFSGVPAAAQTCVPTTWNVSYNGGNAPVMTSPKIYLVLWGFGSPANDPSGEIATLTNVLQGIGGWRWESTDTQYYQIVSSVQTYVTNTNAQFGGVIIDNMRALPVDAPPPPGIGPTLAQWRAAVGAEALNAGTDFSANAIYIVFTPPRTNYPEPTGPTTCNCGWHGSVQRGSSWVAFADLPYATGQCLCYSPSSPYVATSHVSAVALHELKEAITDPLYDHVQRSWTDSCGGEIGDYCNTFTLQKILPDFVAPNTIALPRILSASANGGGSGCAMPPPNGQSNCCVSSYTKNSNRFYVNSFNGKLGYLYTSLGGVGCATSGIWWDGVTLATNVASAAWGPNRIDLYALDTNSHLQHMYTNDGGVSMYGGDDWGPAPSGWTLYGSPSVASWGPYHLDIFSLAKSGSTTALMHWLWNQNADGSFTSTGWENWGSPTDSLSNFVTTGGVGSVSEEPNRVDAFVIGSSSTGHPNLWMAYRFGSTGAPAWYNWGNPGSVNIQGTPAATSWGPGRWDVFVHDTISPSAHLRQWYYDSNCCSGWSDWGMLPGVPGGLTGDPSAIAMGENRLNVYQQGSDQNIYRRSWDFSDLGWSSSIGCSNPGSYIFSLQGTRF